ncbi:FKBP-type peptidyl-prolyl cis-trans isomerase [Phaeodactylibacter luteus]|uniref:Peptidyl-prolyl cis-trans isomerase n=1 Tax=Phaeodactylibacter luteus TaxID=1564516 RepID=A0A5C6S0Q6_9BACT|nr:peptidylprolyl isomerase [Phaeodactylibacter luteus]TXB67579.1 peptidylprolyl isomerase [Phaeodactylibacter luteus]
MKIDKHTVVTLHYKLQEKDADGDMVEQTFGSDPLVFLYGAGSMIPKFEAELSGKKAGDGFAFGIESAEAYGEYDPEAIAPIPKEAFVVDGELAEDILQVGRVIPMRDPDGNQLIGTILEIGDTEVQMNFNHPMAGVDLYFTGQIEEVRAATAEEIEHGHVHGPGGVSH